ncbi:TonB-dependent receptor domain-containing protein [Granulicella cerasi]|uniref:TonB-dependent receptor domain-containing protein n=1 Tax=Granulicella cerasi TaxID=741063 RepID=A0ABW1ZC74_9BACT|nr:TonB-dependent receptor [Granulicella cerasi]
MFLLLLGGAAIATAQTTGTISGVVTDAGGGRLTKVLVTARDTSTGESRTATTNAAGEYSFPALRPADYELKFALEGFATSTEVTTLNVTEHIAVDAKLQLSSVATTVDVSSAEPMLQTESVTQGRVIDGQAVEELPLATNNFTQLLGLSPGVVGELNDATALGRGTQNINANGARTSSNSIYIDGIDAVNVHVNSAGNNAFASNGTIIPPPAAIQEFKVQTALFEAATGRSGGSNIFLITRTGGNAIHGQVYEYFRNTMFNANNWFFNNLGQRKPKLNQNQFGGAIGGPFIKDKLFGFFAYQGTRQVNGYAGTTTIAIPNLPTNRSVTSLGLFGNSLGATSHSGPSILADGSNINPAALKLLQLKFANGNYVVPSPNGSATNTNVNYAVSVPSIFNEDEYSGSMTYRWRDKDTAAFHTVIAEQPQFQSLPSTRSVPGFGLNQLFKSRLYSVSETHVFSPNVVNEFRMGMSRLLGHTGFENQIPLSAIGMTRFNAGDFPNIPLIELSNSYEFGYSVNADQADTENTWQYFDNVNWLKGKHAMNFGFEMRRYQDNYFSNNRMNGSIDVISMQNLMLGRNGQSVAAGGNGTGYSDNYTYSVASGVVQRYDRIRDIALFAQDAYKPTSRLSINIGLRWEYIGLPVDIFGRNGAFDPRRYVAPPAGGVTSMGFVQEGNAVNAVPGIAKVSNTLTDTVGKLNLGPRIGAIYRLNDQMVLRAGYGLFYDRLSNQLGLLESLSVPNYVRADGKNSSGQSGKTPQTPININSSFDNPFPTLPQRSQFPILPQVAAYSSSGTATAPLSINNIDPQIKTPYYQQFGVNIQTQITPAMMLEVGYVGTLGRHLPVETELNQAQLASASNPINGTTVNTGDPQQRAPYQGFSIPGFLYLQTRMTSNYNSLQTTLNYKKGRTNFMVTNTFGKSMDTSSGTADGSVFNNFDGDQTNPRQAYGPSDFDRTDRISARWSYSIPTLPIHGWARGIFRGYDLSGTGVYQTGKPIDITDSSGASQYGTDTSRASWVAGANANTARRYGRTQDRLTAYFNNGTLTNVPAAFTTAGTSYGTVSRNVLRGPSNANVDLSLGKRTRLFAGTALDLRLQAFNVFNHPNFANPAGNVSGSNFGAILSTVGNPRLLQLVAKVQF